MAHAAPEVFTAQAVASMSAQHIAQLLQAKAQTIADLQRQVDWFRRQLFGHKSERFLAEPAPQQMHLGQLLGESAALVEPVEPAQAASTVPAHRRRKPRSDFADTPGSAPFFDETKVPVHTIELRSPEVQGLAAEQYEVIGQKVSHRLAQRPGSFVVLKYVRPIIKRRDTHTLHCAAAPLGVIEGSRADVSFIAGLLVDKFRYHLPLYRQHQRLIDAGFKLSRPWLTQLVQLAAQLLQAIYDAQFESICSGHVITMDEVPVKAGQAGNGQMKATYFWPVYGERDEVCFPHFESRRHEHVEQALGGRLAKDAVLLSDGYGAYLAYAKKLGIEHAQCWAHTRRGIFEARDVEPKAAGCALEQIAAIYKVEEHIRQRKLTGDAKRLHRLTHSKPLVDTFFAWIDQQFEQLGLLPSNPLMKALAYARERRAALGVFLDDPQVPIDTNHIERALRPIPTGRNNWLFCWTEVGAKYTGIVQSLIATCRLQGIDPYTYLVDVLQRVGQHPASRIDELTPRRWKVLFAHQPLRSDLHGAAA